MKKDWSITFLQVVCSFVVVSLHVNNSFFLFSYKPYWVTTIFTQIPFLFAVPIFLMITGITLFDYQDRYTTKEFFKKRIEKTLIPYLGWNVLALLFLFLSKLLPIEKVDFHYLLNGFLNAQILNIYWFFIPLFCIYLATPLFASIDKSKKEKIYKYLVIAGMLFNFIPAFLIDIFKLNITWPYQISVVSSYLFYPIVGYRLYNYPLKKKEKYILYVISFICLVWRMIGTYILSMNAEKVIEKYNGYFDLTCVFYSIGVFLLLMDLSKYLKKNEKIVAFVNYLSKYTFAQYMIHWFIIQIYIGVFNIDIRWWHYRLFGPLIIYALDLIVIKIFRMIPVLKRIVP